MSAVVDASLVVALVTADPRHNAVQAKFEAWFSENEQLHAPAVLPYEIANVLARLTWDGTFDAADLAVTWTNIDLLGLVLHPFEFSTDGPRVAAITTALRRKHATDSSYLCLAERLQAELWTLDGALARGAQAQGFPVQLLA